MACKLANAFGSRYLIMANPVPPGPRLEPARVPFSSPYHDYGQKVLSQFTQVLLYVLRCHHATQSNFISTKMWKKKKISLRTDKNTIIPEVRKWGDPTPGLPLPNHQCVQSLYFSWVFTLSQDYVKLFLFMNARNCTLSILFKNFPTRAQLKLFSNLFLWICTLLLWRWRMGMV